MYLSPSKKTSLTLFLSRTTISNVLLLGMSICFVGIYGKQRDYDWWEMLPDKYKDYVNLSLAASVLSMVAFLILALHKVHKQKSANLGAVVLLLLGEILFFAGMIQGCLVVLNMI